MISFWPLIFDFIFFLPVVLSLIGWGDVALQVLVKVSTRYSKIELPELSPTERLVLEYGLGIGFLALLILIIGMLHLLYFPLLWLILAGGLFAFWQARSVFSLQSIWKDIKPDNRGEWILAIFVAAIMLFQFYGCLMPVVGQDEITYHLTVPRQYLLAHHVHPMPNLFHANMPLNAQMIYLYCMAFGGGMLCKMVQWSIWVMLLVALLQWTRRVESQGGYLALMIYLAAVAGVYVRAPMEAGSDILLGFYFTLSFWCLSRIRNIEKSTLSIHWKGWLIITGIFLGLAWGTKYTSLAFLNPLVIVYLIWQGLVLRINIRTLIPPVLLSCGLAVACFSPWMMRSAIDTHNPFYPIAIDRFPTQSPYLENAEAVNEFYEGWNFYAKDPQKSETLLGRWSLAWNNYHSERVYWSINEGDYLLPLFLIFSILGLFLPLRGIRGLALAGLAGNLIFMIVYGTHLNRYFAMADPLAAILVSSTLIYLFRFSSINWLFPPLFGAVLMLGTVNFQTRWINKIGWDGLAKISQKAQWEFIELRIGDPDALACWRELDNRVPPNAYLLAHNIKYPYYSPRRVYSTGPFEEELFFRLMQLNYGDEQAVTKQILNMGLTHVVIRNRDSISTLPKHWLNKNARLIGTWGQIELWELNQRTSPPAPSPRMERG